LIHAAAKKEDRRTANNRVVDIKEGNSFAMIRHNPTLAFKL
jgi:hypothetical protein